MKYFFLVFSGFFVLTAAAAAGQTRGKHAPGRQAELTAALLKRSGRPAEAAAGRPAELNAALLRRSEKPAEGGPPAASSDFDIARWTSRLKDNSWRERKAALHDKQLAALRQPAGQTFRDAVIGAISLRLADSSQAVRAAAAEALKDWAAPAASSDTKTQALAALAKKQKGDSGAVFLKKIEHAGEIFSSVNLFYLGENMVAIEIARPAWVKAVESAYDLAAAGLDPKKSLEARLAAAGFLDQVLTEQFDQYMALIRKKSIQSPSSMDSAAVFVIEVMADLTLRGMGAARAAAAAASGSKPLKRALTKTSSHADLRFFQMIEESAKGAGWPKWIYPKLDHPRPRGAAETELKNYERPWAVIKPALEKGLSRPEPQIRKRAAALLERFGGMYPALQGRLIAVLEARQGKEGSHSLKAAIRRSLKRLGCKNALRR